MFVVYSYESPTVMEAITSSLDIAIDMSRSNVSWGWSTLKEYMGVLLIQKHKFSIDKLNYVIYNAAFPTQVYAIVRSPEIALDIALDDRENENNQSYEWRVQTDANGLWLYIKPKNKGHWKLVANVPDQGTCHQTMIKLMLEFFHSPDYKLPLKVCALDEYRTISNAMLTKVEAIAESATAFYEFMYNRLRSS